MSTHDRRLQRLEDRLGPPVCPACAKRAAATEHFDYEGYRRIFEELVAGPIVDLADYRDGGGDDGA